VNSDSCFAGFDLELLQVGRRLLAERVVFCDGLGDERVDLRLLVGREFRHAADVVDGLRAIVASCSTF
jgi:hypothetical protein